MSRYPLENQDLSIFSEKCTIKEVEALINGSVNQSQDGETWLCNVNVAEIHNQLLYEAGDTTRKIDHKDLVSAQDSEPWIKRVKEIIKQKLIPDENFKKKELKETRNLLRYFDQLQLDNSGILYRKHAESKQLILPSKYKPLVYSELHVKMGHLGKDRTIQLAKQRFYWPKMEEDISYFVTNICQRIKSKKPNLNITAPMKTITSTRPLELVGLDFLHLDTCNGGYQYLLVVTDHFTRYTEAYATTNKTAPTAANKLYNSFILRYGIPEKIIHDQGGEFENKRFRQLSSLCGIKKLRTTPYHPQTNGQVERMNRTIISMLKCLPEQYKTQWRNHVDKLTHAYNCTQNSSTGYSPHYLMFGRHPKLPIDLIIQPSQEDSECD